MLVTYSIDHLTLSALTIQEASLQSCPGTWCGGALGQLSSWCFTLLNPEKFASIKWLRLSFFEEVYSPDDSWMRSSLAPGFLARISWSFIASNADAMPAQKLFQLSLFQAMIASVYSLWALLQRSQYAGDLVLFIILQHFRALERSPCSRSPHHGTTFAAPEGPEGQLFL